MTVSADHRINLVDLLGFVRCESNWRSEEGKLVSEWRFVNYNAYGKVIYDTGWKDSGIEIVWEG